MLLLKQLLGHRHFCLDCSWRGLFDSNVFCHAKPTSFSLSQGRKGKPCSHFKEYLKSTVASSFNFLCCALECLIMKDESFLFLSCECSSCFMGQIGWFLCVPFQCCLYLGEGGNSDFTEMLNLKLLEEVRMCIWGLSSFSESRHLKRLMCDQACQVERMVRGHQKPPCPSSQWISQVTNLCTLWHIKTIFLSLSLEAYTAEIAA